MEKLNEIEIKTRKLRQNIAKLRSYIRKNAYGQNGLGQSLELVENIRELSSFLAYQKGKAEAEQSIRADERGKCIFTDDELLLMKIWGMFVRDTEKDFTEDEFAVLEKLNKIVG